MVSLEKNIMNDKIDIVVPWLNPNEKWYNEYKKYSKNENPARVRDFGTFKYVLRSIDKNINWLNKLYIILYDETQVPEWLNTNYDKVKIIYHKDLLPAERLPNFSSVQVDMRLSFIKELSDNFIFINDDMFFTKNIPDTVYFRNNKPVHIPTMRMVNNYNSLTKAQWGKIEKNNYEFVNKALNSRVKLHFWTGHLPIPFNKTFQQFAWFKYKKEFEAALAGEHIRANNNLSNWVFYNLEEATKNCILVDKTQLPKQTYFSLSNKTTYNDIISALNKNSIICINDSDGLTRNFEKVKNNVLKALNNKFPEKSKFEK